MANDPVVLTVVFGEFEAEELCGLLEVNNIDSMYRRTTAGMDLGGSMRGPIEVLVGEDDLERAQELLAASPEEDDGSGSPD
jgi:hypothetical protein